MINIEEILNRFLKDTDELKNNIISKFGTNIKVNMVQKDEIKNYILCFYKNKINNLDDNYKKIYLEFLKECTKTLNDI